MNKRRIKESAQKSKPLKSNVDLNGRNSINLVSNKEIVDTKSCSHKKSKAFDLATITNKLYRFRKKT